MKKLRASSEEREAFLKAIRDELYGGFYGGVLGDFSIDSIKKDFSEIPKDIIKPTLKIPANMYVKMLELVNQSPVECSWHGLVQRNKEKQIYVIYDILVFPQINSTTTTTTDENEFAEWQTKLILDPDFPIEDMRLHGHSHVNMNVFSSGIDDQYQKDLLTKVDDDDYYIFLIMNKKMEMCIFIYDFSQQVMFETKDIKLELISIALNSSDEDIRAWAKKELKDKAITATTRNVRAVYDPEPDLYVSYLTKAKPVFNKERKHGSK